MKNDFMERPFSHPALRDGEPCIKGTRIPVRVIVASFGEGLARPAPLVKLKDKDWGGDASRR
jgi:hypothetical protein